MALSSRPSLRNRLQQRAHRESRTAQPLDLPATGRIAPRQLRQIHTLAASAQGGDIGCRNLLYLSLRPRLGRIASMLRPWPNTLTHIGVWDQDDVEQEGYLIFAELLDAWNSEVPFIPFLLARFPWRLRDRILRGIGKPRAPRGMISVPEHSLLDRLIGSEQPEQAAIARETLEDLLANLARLLELQGESAAIVQLLSDIRALRPDLDAPIAASRHRDAA